MMDRISQSNFSLSNNERSRRTEIWLLPVVALAFAARLYRLDEQSYWFDEIFTVAMARLSWYNGLVGVLGHGIQLTPVFHWVIKLWLLIGDSDWLLRAPAMIFGVLTVPLVFKLGQFYFDDKVGLLGAFIFAINPFQIWYGQELRLYTLLAFASAGAMLSFGQMLRSQGRQGTWRLFFYNLIGLPTHYFMFLVSTVQFLYLVVTLKQNYHLIRRWTLVHILAVLPLAAWWIFILQQKRDNVGIGWVPRPQWLTPLYSLWNFNFGYTGTLSVATIVFLGVMLLGLGLGLRQVWREPGRGWLFTLWLVFPPLITILFSFGRVSFYVDRYLIIITPILTLLTVYGLLNIRQQWLSWGLLLIFVVATGVGLWHVYFDRANFAKNDWRILAQSIDARVLADEAVITCTDGYRLAFEYYNPHQAISSADVLDAAQVYTAARLPGYQRVWIIVTHPLQSVHALANIEPPDWDRTLLSPEAAAWEAENIQDEITVVGISAYQYNIIDSSALAEIVAWRCRG